MTAEEFQQRLKELEKEFKQLYVKYAPDIAGTIAVRLFKENFQNEGFFGQSWKEVNRRRGQTKGKAKAWSRRKILTGDTGDLGRSIEYKLDSEGMAIIFTNPSSFKSKEPYGRVHNEGLRAGRGRGFIMPKRQFMGYHPELAKAIIEGIEEKINEIKEKK